MGGRAGIQKLGGVSGWRVEVLAGGWEPAVETAPEGASRRETRLRGLGLGEGAGGCERSSVGSVRDESVWRRCRDGDLSGGLYADLGEHLIILALPVI